MTATTGYQKLSKAEEEVRRAISYQFVSLELLKETTLCGNGTRQKPAKGKKEAEATGGSDVTQLSLEATKTVPCPVLTRASGRLNRVEDAS